MSKKKYIVVQVLDPGEVSGYSNAQKSHYLSLGYLPCLLANGTTKWLTESQRVIRAAKANKPFFSFSSKPYKPMKNRHTRKRHRSDFQKFLYDNWKFLCLLLSVLVVLWVLLVYWNRIFGF